MTYMLVFNIPTLSWLRMQDSTAEKYSISSLLWCIMLTKRGSMRLSRICSVITPALKSSATNQKNSKSLGFPEPWALDFYLDPFSFQLGKAKMDRKIRKCHEGESRLVLQCPGKWSKLPSIGNQPRRLDSKLQRVGEQTSPKMNIVGMWDWSGWRLRIWSLPKENEYRVG